MDGLTGKELEAYQALLKKKNQLVDEVVDLVIKKHGVFLNVWVNWECWTPGTEEIQVDGAISLKTIRLLDELFGLPDARGLVEGFDFKKYEKIRDTLRKEAAERRPS